MTSKKNCKKNENYRNFSNRGSYNNASGKSGQVLAPFVTNYHDARYYSFNMENLETWHFSGRPILIGFAWVDGDKFEHAMKVFHQDVHLFLNPQEEETDDLSLDALLDAANDEDKVGFDPTASEENEKFELLKFSLCMLFDFYKSDGRSDWVRVLTMLGEGYSKKEIAAEVFPDLGRSRTYELIDQIQDEGYNDLMENFYIG